MHTKEQHKVTIFNPVASIFMSTSGPGICLFVNQCLIKFDEIKWRYTII